MAKSPFDLSGKVALITGGNTGIGLGMARGLAEAGCHISIWGTNGEANAAAVDELSAYGIKAQAWCCDITDSNAVRQTFAEVLKDFGRVDGCFANVGVSCYQDSFLDISDAEWRRIISINLDGAFFTFKAAVPHMLSRAAQGNPGGRLIATSSMGAITGMPRNQHYGASKAGLISLVKSLAVEYGPHGITAHAILPGWTDTRMTRDTLENPEFREAVLPKIPTRRWGTPEDYAGLAVYLMSDASSYHTGNAFLIDGGYLI